MPSITDVAVIEPAFAVAPAEWSFSLYGSTPETGELWHGFGRWRVKNRFGITVKRADGPLSFGWVAPDDELYKVWGQYVDRTGAGGDWVVIDVLADEAPTLVRHVDPVAGDDSTGDGSVGNPWETPAHGMTQLLAAHASGTMSVLRVKAGTDHTPGAAILNDNSYNGVIRVESYGEGARPIIRFASGTTLMTNNSTNGGVHSVGIHWDGGYGGGAAGTGTVLFRFAQASGSGYRVMLYDSLFMNMPQNAVTVTTTAPITGKASGDFDHFTVVGCTFDNISSETIGGSHGRGVIVYDNQFLRSTGNGTGSMMRGNSWSGYIADNTFDRSSSTYKSNNLRINAGLGTSADDRSNRLDVYRNTFIDCEAGVQIDAYNDSDGTFYHQDVRIIGNKINLRAGALGSCISINGGINYSQDITRCVFRLNQCYKGGVPAVINIAPSGNSTTGKIHSLLIERNSAICAAANGSFTRSTSFLSIGGNVANTDDGAIILLNNNCHSTVTGGDNQLRFMTTPGAAKFAACDGNRYTAAISDITWHDADSLATWQGATTFDDASTATASTSTHNMTTITAGSGLDLRPASGTGPQIDTGIAGYLAVDIDGKLVASSIDAGIGEWNGGDAPEPPPESPDPGLWRKPGLPVLPILPVL